MSSAAPPNSTREDGGISIVLPVEGDEHALAGALEGYAAALGRLGLQWEILLVPQASDTTLEQARSVDPAIQVCPPASGWGAAVRTGLRASAGDVLCYANWQRTSAAALTNMFELALRNRAVVLRANRRTRDTRIQRIGSLLFNLQCRFVLQVPAWDVNGTPKIFPRTFSKLLELTRDDDLLDAEFALVCEQAGYPVIEIPVDAYLLPGAGSPRPPDYRAALRMYCGIWGLRTARGEKL
jgi:hypothetical protein